MKAYQENIVKEYKELTEKSKNLHRVLQNREVWEHPEERNIANIQLKIMELYRDLLIQRLLISIPEEEIENLNKLIED